MIVGTIKDAAKYASVNEAFGPLFEKLAAIVPGVATREVLKEGEVWYGAGGGEGAKKKEREEGEVRFEAHRNFIDIHYIVRGEETFGYNDLSHLTVTQDYNPENDALFLTGPVNEITLKAGDFCVVFPEDAHAPCMDCVEGHIRCVAKIKV